MKDPSTLNLEGIQKKENMYRKIELYSDEQMDKLTRSLDDEQRMVLDIVVDFTVSVVKSRKTHVQYKDIPLLIVQGGAGSGKSMLIDAMCQQIEKLIRNSGDDPNHPYCIKAAYTGTAAANIKGQTLHSSFALNFGNKFLSLGDKVRD